MTSRQKAKQLHKSRIVVLSAPSGTGKTTLVNELKKRCDDIAVSVSYTTRSPRPGETKGIDYHFIGQDNFKKKIRDGFFAEWAKVYDNYYGTSKDFIEKNIKKSKIVLLTIDTQGGLQIKKQYPEAILIGILPPSLKEQEIRLKKRGETSENIRRRLKESSMERKILIEKYDYRFINRDIESTARKILSIISKIKK
ncbi:MAG: guanylate kinase [Candidatus Omnitrophica bacterium]|nr:guanylate kinase [Candidatus Omnitrophota bacterium]MCM8825329.1 guanylate kinase [Candidatus Omnitrophota bacterium]